MNIQHLSTYWRGILLVLSLLLYQISASQVAPRYLGFSALEWKPAAANQKPCLSGGAPKHLAGSEASLGNLPEPSVACDSQSARIVLPASFQTSSELSLGDTIIEFYFLGTLDSLTSSLKLEDDKQHSYPLSSLTQVNDRSFQDGRHWRRAQFSLSELSAASSFVIQLSLKAEDTLVLRNKLGFYQNAPVWGLVSNVFSSSTGKLLTSLLLAFSLLTFFLSVDELPLTKTQVALLLLAVSFGVHFRSSAFFYFDEWHVLERFQEIGITGVIYTHNEHFLPLFFLLYYLQVLLFSEHYLAYTLFSVLIHAFNAYLLWHFLLTFQKGERDENKKASLFLALLFCLSSLHAESLHWAFEQCLLLSQTLALSAFLLLRKFLVLGSTQSLLGVLVCVFLSPLLFGNGFILPVQLALYALFICLRFQVFFSTYGLERIFKLGLGCIVAAGAPALMYALNTEGSGHGTTDLKPLEDISLLFSYIFVGAELGAFLRGLGLFPFLEAQTPANLLSSFFGIVKDPELLLAWIGLGVSLLLLVPSLFTKKRGSATLVWLFGKLIMLTVFILPALGRWHLGTAQSLSLRYQYAALIGMAILLLPVTSLLMEKVFNFFTTKTTTRLVFVIFSALFATQLYVGANFSYFTSRGLAHRIYIAHLLDWKERTGLGKDGASISFEASGTALEHLNPDSAESVTPGRHPLQILSVYQWLRGATPR